MNYVDEGVANVVAGFWRSEQANDPEISESLFRSRNSGSAHRFIIESTHGWARIDSSHLHLTASFKARLWNAHVCWIPPGL